MDYLDNVFIFFINFNMCIGWWYQLLLTWIEVEVCLVICITSHQRYIVATLKKSMSLKEKKSEDGVSI